MSDVIRRQTAQRGRPFGSGASPRGGGIYLRRHGDVRQGRDDGGGDVRMDGGGGAGSGRWAGHDPGPGARTYDPSRRAAGRAASLGPRPGSPDQPENVQEMRATMRAMREQMEDMQRQLEGGTAAGASGAASPASSRTPGLAMAGARQYVDGDDAGDGGGSAGRSTSAMVGGRRRREASVEPDEQRLAAEPAYSAGYLTHASEEDRTKKHEVEEMSMGQFGPDEEWYDMSLIALAAEDCTASTEEAPAKMAWGTTGWRRILVMTRLLIECERPTGRRTIDERWTAAARNAILKEAPWLAGVRMADDRRFPYSAEYASGRNCTAVKFAKRVLWIEMALRLWAVVGTGVVDGGGDARWRRIMSFTTEGEFVAEEDLTDEAQLTTACGADMAAARSYLAQAWQRNVDTGGADLSVASVLHVWDAAMKEDKKGPYEYEAPDGDADGGEEVGPQATRRLKCSRGAEGVVFVTADGARKFVLTDGEPGPHAFAPYEQMMGIETEHVKCGREAVKGAAQGAERVSGSKEWLRDLFAECGEGEQLRDIAERMAATVAPGLALAQRAARASAPVSSDVVARQKALGWTSELGSGDAWGAAMKMRVLHIQAEADHVGDGRTATMRSPPRVTARAGTGGSDSAGGRSAPAAPAVPAMYTDATGGFDFGDGRYEMDDGEPMTVGSLVDTHGAGAWRMPDANGQGHAQDSGRGDDGDYGGGYGGGGHASGRTGGYGARSGAGEFATMMSELLASQRSGKFGVGRAAATQLQKFEEMGLKEVPTMAMTMAARAVLPQALRQHHNVDADLQMMGAPSGVAQYIQRAQTLLEAKKFYPPKGQLAMLLQGLTGKTPGFAPLVFQRVAGLDDASKQVAQMQVDALDAAGKSKKVSVKWSPSFSQVDSQERYTSMIDGLTAAMSFATFGVAEGFDGLIEYLLDHRTEADGRVSWREMYEELLTIFHERAAAMELAEVGGAETIPPWYVLPTAVADTHRWRLHEQKQADKRMKQLLLEMGYSPQAAQAKVDATLRYREQEKLDRKARDKADKAAKAQARAAAAGNGAGITAAATADGGTRGGGKGSCFEWASSGTCRHGATCKFTHDGSGGGGGPAAKVKAEPQATGGNAARPGNGGRTPEMVQRWKTRPEPNRTGEPPEPVRADGIIMGKWIFAWDRWSICVQTMGYCWERHARNKGDCKCAKCQASTKWPPGVSERIRDPAWSGDPG